MERDFARNVKPMKVESSSTSTIKRINNEHQLEVEHISNPISSASHMPAIPSLAPLPSTSDINLADDDDIEEEEPSGVDEATQV